MSNTSRPNSSNNTLIARCAMERMPLLGYTICRLMDHLTGNPGGILKSAQSLVNCAVQVAHQGKQGATASKLQHTEACAKPLCSADISSAFVAQAATIVQHIREQLLTVQLAKLSFVIFQEIGALCSHT